MKFFKVSLYIVMILGFMLLPLFSFNGYSIIEHTTSHLAAQGSPNAWVMNIIFILLGSTSMYIAIKTKSRFHQTIGIIFGLSLIGAAFFRHAPINEMFEGNLFEDQLHSVFATTTGFSFVLLAFGHGFMHQKKQRYFGFTVGLVATLISLGMMFFPEVLGILQRIMFTSAFYWLFFYMKVNQQFIHNKKT